jgi:hypothetical protein
MSKEAVARLRETLQRWAKQEKVRIDDAGKRRDDMQWQSAVAAEKAYKAVLFWIDFELSRPVLSSGDVVPNSR